MYYNRYSAWVNPLSNGYNPYRMEQINKVEDMLRDDLIRKHIALSMLNDGIASNDTAAILIGMNGRYI